MWNGSELTKLLRNIFGRKPEQQAVKGHGSLRAVVESGDFRINFGNRLATLHNEALDLTSEEFDVLVFLVNHPQRLVTPHTVLATSWTTSRPRQTEFLRVLFSLRKKLDAVAPGKHFRTEPWVAYRFNPSPSLAT
jgi:DNA-binding response OmpR family regulator